MFSDVSPIFVIFSTSFIMYSAALQDRTPGKMLYQYSNLVRADKILVSDKDQVRAVCWFFKRNDVYLLAVRGELMYGIKSCNDFMKLPKIYLRDLISERFTRRLFGWLKFLSPQPRKRDLRLPSTNYGVFLNFYHSPPGCGTALSL
jgi:hypothetical protein